MIVGVYGLFDPDTDELRYVGLSGDEEKRMTLHWARRSQPSLLCAWLRQLAESGKRPVVRRLADMMSYRGGPSDWLWGGYYLEKEVIQQYASDRLLNVTHNALTAAPRRRRRAA